MRVRRLDPNGDYSFGHGLSDFHVDTPDAVAQVAKTRLALWQGQWFLNLNEGMPWKTRVLGERTTTTRDPAIRARILGTPGVVGIDDYSSFTDPSTRALSVSATITTVYSASASLTATVQGNT